MVRTTRAQRVAIHKIHGRARQADTPTPLAYLAFRRQVQPTFGCDGAVAVPAFGMWLCVERDGYTHS